MNSRKSAGESAVSIPQRGYDPDKAKHHLKKAGLDGLKVTIHAAATAFEGAVDAGSLYAESAKAAPPAIQRRLDGA